MRLLIFPLLLICGASFTPLSAQFGVTGSYNLNSAKSKAGNASLGIPYDDAPEIAAHYWFRLSKKRLEFQPSLYYSKAGGDLNWSEVGFQFKTNLYPFDFGTDCHCPTFGKQGPQLQKGLFLQLSPGLAWHNYRFPDDSGQSSTLAPTLGLGVGVDFGISNAVTITPIVAWRYTLSDFVDLTSADDFGNLIAEDIDGRLSTLQLGVQATVRLDKKRY